MEEQTTLPSCETCRFYQQHGETDSGDCRRYAPRPIQWGEAPDEDGNRGDNLRVWPEVSYDDWCGEYEAKL